MEAAAQQMTGGTEQKLKIDKFADGPVTCLKFMGTIDEEFDGKKIASTLKGGTLVLDLAEISKISSFGIREWVDFVGRASQSVDAIVLIECAPKVVDQLNMVANFAGKGRVFSFYAPYRCDYCDVDRRVLLQIDSDYDAIKNMKPPERPCETCGNPEYFDEDPTTFFSYLAGQQKFDLDPQVASFLSAKLNYAVSDAARRLRAEKTVEGRSTYLKIAGDLDGSFPREKIAEGLEGTIVLDVSGVGKVDPAGAAEWRGLLAMITPGCDNIYLLGCPPVFLERLTNTQDLGGKAQVLSFAMPYSCSKCATTASQTIDVEMHYDVLKFATPPEMKCTDCGGPTTCAAAESLLSHLPTLPKVTVEQVVRKFIKEVQERKPEKQQISTTLADAAAAGARSNLVTTMVSLAGAAVIAAGVVIGYSAYQAKQQKAMIRARDAVGVLQNKSADKRPDWITSDTRFSSACAELGGTIQCVGVSAFSDTQEEARIDASEAALEELTNHIGLKIEDPAFAQIVRTSYGDARSLALTEFDNSRYDSDGSKYDRSRRIVREGRKNVTAALRRSAGAAVPGQPTAEYWEQYDAVIGGSSKFLVFVEYSLPVTSVKALVDRYSTVPQGECAGARTLAVFPAMAWRYPDVSEGAVLVALNDGLLKQMGLSAGYVVQSIRDRQVRDAGDFCVKINEEHNRLKKDGGNLKLQIKTGDGPSVDFNRPISRTVIEGGTIIIRPSGPRQPGGSGGVNIWEKTGGGGGGRDNPNE